MQPFGHVVGCTAIKNDAGGMLLGVQGWIESSTAVGNQDDGIEVEAHSRVIGCVSTINKSNGIRAALDTRVEGCDVHSNKQSGVRAADRSTIVGNSCSENGSPGVGAGIWVTGQFSVIERNVCIQNEYAGFVVEGTSNFLRRNSAGSNVANWAIFAGNFVHVVPAASSAAVLGDAGGIAPGPNDPNANYTL